MEQEIKNEEFQNEAAKEVTEEVKEEETATAAEASEEKESTGGEKPEETEAGEEPEMLKKKKKKDKMEEKIEELEDRVKRQMAEFDNFRKRTEKEKSHMYEVGARDVIEKILPVVDNFERGLASVPEDQKENPEISFDKEQDKMILNQMQNKLSRIKKMDIRHSSVQRAAYL